MNTLMLSLSRTSLWGVLMLLFACAGFLFSAPAVHAAEGWIYGGGTTDGGTNPPNPPFDGTAWFSMNSSNTGDPSVDGRYLVNIPTADGDISGYAWSGGTDTSTGEFYGWLSFEEGTHSVAACGGRDPAKRVANKIVGAAIIVASAGQGGFDGCVVFDHGQAGYEVTIDSGTGKMSGYAWSSDYGWLDFSKVTTAASGAKDGTLLGHDCWIPVGQSSCSPTLDWTVNEWVTAAELRDTENNKVNLTIPPLMGVYTVVPALAHGASKAFSLWGSSASTAMEEMEPSFTVKAQCVAGLIWSDGVCKAAVPAGNIIVKDTAGVDVTSNPNCTIITGQSSCTRTVEWVWTTPSLNPSFTKDGSIVTNGTAISGTGVHTFPSALTSASYTSGSTFSLNDGVTSVRSITVKGQCASGAFWDGNSCELIVAPEGFITLGPCIVPDGQKGCTATVSWDANSAVVDPQFWESIEGAAQIRKLLKSFTVYLTMKPDRTGQSAVYTLYSGTNLPANIIKGPATTTATCANGSAYNPTLQICQSTALSATLTGSNTCEIADGASTCASVPLTWSLTGVFGTSAVKVLESGYFSASMWGSEPNPATVSSTTVFRNVVSFGTTSFKVVGWVNNDPQEVMPVLEVKGSCKPGSQPTGGVCQPIPGPSATISFTPGECSILEGESRCTVTVNWTVSNVNSTPYSAILRIGGVGTSTQQRDGPHTFTYVHTGGLTNPSFDVVLTDAGTTRIGGPTSLVVKCAGSATWTGGVCQTVANTITANPANTCTITAVDGENCAVTLSWNTSASTPVLSIASTTSSVTSNELRTDSKIVHLVPGTYEFSILDGASVKAAVSNYQVVCADGLVWNEFPSAGNSQACVSVAKSNILFQYEGGTRDYDAFCEIAENSSQCTTNITASVSAGTSEAKMYKRYIPTNGSNYEPMLPLVKAGTDRNVSATQTFGSITLEYGETRFKIIDENGLGADIELLDQDDTIGDDPAARAARADCMPGLTFDFAASPPRCRNISGQQ